MFSPTTVIFPHDILFTLRVRLSSRRRLVEGLDSPIKLGNDEQLQS